MPALHSPAEQTRLWVQRIILCPAVKNGSPQTAEFGLEKSEFAKLSSGAGPQHRQGQQKAAMREGCIHRPASSHASQALNAFLGVSYAKAVHC